MNALAMEATATAVATMGAGTTAAVAGADWRTVAVTVLGGIFVAIVNGYFSTQREKARR